MFSRRKVVMFLLILVYTFHMKESEKSKLSLPLPKLGEGGVRVKLPYSLIHPSS